MKRRLEDPDDGGIRNPAKMLFTGPDMYAGGMINPSAISPQQLGPPIQASTPQTLSYTGDRRRLTPISRGLTMQTNPAAENELRHVIDNFVSIYEQLDKSDNPDVKPNYSYSELAYLAMLRSPNFCLPIGQIYSYIQSRFKFFQNSTRKHWKNAVRHSLAKTMCFSKIPVGRGTSTNENLARSTYLWCILPNSIACFARGDYRATVDRESGTNTLRSAYFRTNSETFWHSVGDYIATKMAIFKNTLETSPNPGLIFESQTCVFPWRQQKTQSLTQRRKVFENIQNHQRNEINKVPGNSDYTTQSNFQMQKPVSSPEYLLSPDQDHMSQNSNLYYAQTRSSSPLLRMPDAQSQNELSYVDRATPPHISDPWLTGYHTSSIGTGFSSSDLDRKTPATPFNCSDSGYLDGSPTESSCIFLSSCKETGTDRSFTSPVSNHFYTEPSSNEEYEFDQFDLSPFSLSDFSDLSENREQPRITPEKRLTNHVTSHVTQNVGQPLFISTPITSQTSRAEPCKFMYQAVSPMQSYGQALGTTAPVVFVNSNGTYSTAMLPNWVSYS